MKALDNKLRCSLKAEMWNPSPCGKTMRQKLNVSKKNRSGECKAKREAQLLLFEEKKQRIVNSQTK